MFEIDPEFQAAIPPLSETELSILTESLKAEGCRESLLVWNGLLIDGHNRYEICTAHDIPFKTSGVYFASRTDALIWIKKNQLGRRNLTDYQRAEIALSLKEDLAKLARERMLAGKFDPVQNSAHGNEGKTRDALAGIAGVSHDTLAKVERIEAEAIPEIRKMARHGNVSIHAASQIAALSESDQRIVAEDIEAGTKPSEAVKKAHVAHNSGNNEWYTPAHYVEAARKVMGGIDLDPASSEIANHTVKALRFFTANDNGLEQQWGGRVWMNPPYAQPLIAQFIERMIEQYCANAVTEAIVLVNNATDTAWGQTLLKSATSVCFPKARIRFLDPTGNPSGSPLQGQMIVYLGKHRDRFSQEFAGFGACFVNR